MSDFIVIAFIIAALFIIVVIANVHSKTPKYDDRGFDKKRVHKNGTRYDDNGYDYFGFDRNGYDASGYDRRGFDRNGYNTSGYNIFGKNKEGKYNRMFDIENFQRGAYSSDGFLNPYQNPVALTDHARSRMRERMGIQHDARMNQMALDAYRFGRSARQLKKTSAALVREIENKNDNSIALIYRNYIYIFSEENVLITVYKNGNIPL